MTTETQPQKFLDTRTVSHVLGVSQSTIKRLRASGEGPAYHKFGASVRYYVGDVKDYIQQTRIGTDCPSSYKMAQVSARAKRDFAHLFG